MASPLNRLPLNALRSFEVAARRASFNDAAEELGVTPSAVSLQVRRLEEQIGRPLFVRSRRGRTLSETGARLAPRLSELFSALEQLLVEVLEPQSAALRITAMPSFAAKWLAPRLARFTAANPEYLIRVEGSDELFNFDRDDADVGVRYGAGQYPGLFSELLAAVQAFPVCSPEFRATHEASLSEAAGLLSVPLLHDETAERDLGLPTWTAWLANAGVDAASLRRAPVFDSLHMALAAAQSGQGVALGLSPLVDDDLEHGRLVRLFDVALASSYGFWAVCREGRQSERKIAAFRRWLKGEMQGPARPCARNGP